MRIGFDVLAIILGVIVVGTTGNPGVLALAIADIGLATTDVAVQTFKEKIQALEGGSEFLAAWEKVYLTGGLVTAGPAAISGLLKGGAALLRVAQAAKNFKALNFVRACVLKVFLEIEIANFTKNSVKFFTTETELVLATKGVLDNFKISQLLKREVIVVAGEVKTDRGVEEQIALIYKGEAIVKANKWEFSKACSDIIKKLPHEKEFFELCEFLKNISILKKEDNFVKLLQKVLTYKHHALIRYISIEEEAVISYYTTSAYQDLNKFLRDLLEIKDEKLIEKLIAFRDALSFSLNKLPNSRLKTFYRSFYMNEGELKKLYVEGKIYNEKGFMSAAYDYDDFLKNWLQNNPFHNVIMKVEGKTAKEISSISELPEEAEAMFVYGKNFDVVRVYVDVDPISYTKKMYFIVLKEK